MWLTGGLTRAFRPADPTRTADGRGRAAGWVAMFTKTFAQTPSPSPLSAREQSSLSLRPCGFSSQADVALCRRLHRPSGVSPAGWGGPRCGLSAETPPLASWSQELCPETGTLGVSACGCIFQSLFHTLPKVNFREALLCFQSFRGVL